MGPERDLCERLEEEVVGRDLKEGYCEWDLGWKTVVCSVDREMDEG